MPRNNETKLQVRDLVRPTLITLTLLSVPLFAMIFDWRVTDPGSPKLERVNWDYFDFIVMGMLIFSVVLVYEILKYKVSTKINKLALALVLLIIFLLIWAELAVGIFGTPFAGS